MTSWECFAPRWSVADWSDEHEPEAGILARRLECRSRLAAPARGVTNARARAAGEARVGIGMNTDPDSWRFLTMQANRRKPHRPARSRPRGKLPAGTPEPWFTAWIQQLIDRGGGRRLRSHEIRHRDRDSSFSIPWIGGRFLGNYNGPLLDPPLSASLACAGPAKAEAGGARHYTAGSG